MYVGNTLLTPMVKVYRFKLFKKTTKFKRYNRGITKFIINRKKYILRKKRTSMQFIFNLTYYWTQIYLCLRNSIRFYQSLSILEYNFTLSNKHFLNKAVSKNIGLVSSYTVSLLKKGIFRNKSLYIPQQLKGLNNLFQNTQMGFINFNTLNHLTREENIDSGILTDLKHNYTIDFKKIVPTNTISTKNAFFYKLYTLALQKVKQFRKIITLLILFSLKT